MSSIYMPSIIVSGGQTGADRAGLDWAMRNGIPRGGWCPKGRKALDGPLDEKYQLTETPSPKYSQRTLWNVRDSDATIVFTLADEATGGSMKTLEIAMRLGKPCLHFFPARHRDDLSKFIGNYKPGTLNIAGSREEKEPGLYLWTLETHDCYFGS